jgi:hypothetical protein
MISSSIMANTLAPFHSTWNVGTTSTWNTRHRRLPSTRATTRHHLPSNCIGHHQSLTCLGTITLRVVIRRLPTSSKVSAPTHHRHFCAAEPFTAAADRSTTKSFLPTRWRKTEQVSNGQRLPTFLVFFNEKRLQSLVDKIRCITFVFHSIEYVPSQSV